MINSTNYICNDPIYKYGYTLRYWRLRLKISFFFLVGGEGHYSIHNCHIKGILFKSKEKSLKECTYSSDNCVLECKKAREEKANK